MTARIAELEDAAEQARSRANKLEKDKTKLQIEIRDISLQLEAANVNLNEMAKRLKQAETLNGDLQRRVDELTSELQSAHSDNQRMGAELARLRVSVNELQERADALARENKQLSDALREAQSQKSALSESDLRGSIISRVKGRVKALNPQKARRFSFLHHG